MKFPRRNKLASRKNIRLDVNYNYPNDNPIIKPHGFWYSCGSAWYDWIVDEEMTEGNNWLKKYLYEIELKRGSLTDINHKDPDKILVIKNMKDLNKFNRKYGSYRNYYDDELWSINWGKVSKDYGGIEICPYPKRIVGDKYSWLRTFDAASGCIWNLRPIIKSLELTHKKKGIKYVKV